MSDEMSQKLDRTMKAVARLEGTVAEMKDFMIAQMATKKDIGALNNRMDGFSGLLIDMRHRWAVQSDTLTKHDERLRKLESPSA